VNETLHRRLRPYPEYKSSGVDWLGKIPVHWETRPLRRLLRSIEQGWSPIAEDRQANEDEWAVIKLSAIHAGTFRDGEHKALPASLEPLPALEIHKGDILLTRANTPELVGAVCLVRKTRPRLLLCDLAYRIMAADTVIAPPFLVYWLLSEAGRHQIKVDARGSSRSMVKISQGHIKSWACIVPPIGEQRTIMAYLDRETAEIDALAAKKRRLIELLQEKRTALINHAVTKGLDPTVATKRSGVDWLREVPVHWQMTRLRHVIHKIEQGWSPECDNLPADQNQWGVLKAGCVNHGSFNEEDNKALQPGVNPVESLEVRGGDVLMSRASGSPKLIGSVAYVPRCRPKLLLSDKLFRLFCEEHRVAATYLPFVLGAQIGRMQIEQAISGAGGLANNIGQSTIKNILIPLPPLHEQKLLLDNLTASTGELDALIQDVGKAIHRLEEYRTALISAAVTGKIDVREEIP